MIVSEMLAVLCEERKNLEEAIFSLERIQYRGSKHQEQLTSGMKLKKLGRPPGSKNKKIRLVPRAVAASE